MFDKSLVESEKALAALKSSSTKIKCPSCEFPDLVKLNDGQSPNYDGKFADLSQQVESLTKLITGELSDVTPTNSRPSSPSSYSGVVKKNLKKSSQSALQPDFERVFAENEKKKAAAESENRHRRSAVVKRLQNDDLKSECPQSLKVDIAELCTSAGVDPADVECTHRMGDPRKIKFKPNWLRPVKVTFVNEWTSRTFVAKLRELQYGIAWEEKWGKARVRESQPKEERRLNGIKFRLNAANADETLSYSVRKMKLVRYKLNGDGGWKLDASYTYEPPQEENLHSEETSSRVPTPVSDSGEE